MPATSVGPWDCGEGSDLRMHRKGQARHRYLDRGSYVNVVHAADAGWRACHNCLLSSQSNSIIVLDQCWGIKRTAHHVVLGKGHYHSIHKHQRQSARAENGSPLRGVEAAQQAVWAPGKPLLRRAAGAHTSRALINACWTLGSVVVR